MSFDDSGLTGEGRIIPAFQQEAWAEALSAFSSPDVYFTCGYHRLSEIDAQREAFLYWHRTAGHTICFPFLSDVIPQSIYPDRTFHDFESCYGYTGPLATTTDPEILDQLWAPFRAWCPSVGMVAGITRFHPLLQTDRFAARETRLCFNREMIYIDLEQDEASLWASYPAKQRNQIRQSTRNGLVARWGNRDEIKSKFVPIYLEAMKYAGATERYAFNDSYFDYLSGSFGELEVLFIEKDAVPVAGALFLQGRELYHYHLSGSLRPNNLLLHEAALHAMHLGYKRFHLGGGRTTAADDALFKFKASFSPHTTKYLIGETVCLPEIHQRLCDDWLDRAGISERPASLRFYRDPLPGGTGSGFVAP